MKKSWDVEPVNNLYHNSVCVTVVHIITVLELWHECLIITLDILATP